MSRPGDNELVRAAVKPRTYQRYKTAVSRFLKWLDDHNLDPTFSTIDDVLSSYILSLYRKGKGKSASTDVLAGLQFFYPDLKKQHLPVAYRAKRGWFKKSPSQPYPPITWGCTVLVGLHIARTHYRLGVGVLLAFDCFLRSGELLGLRSSDVSTPLDARRDRRSGTILRLAHTKTGDDQSVRVHDPDVEALLLDLLRRTRPGAPLFPYSGETLRRLFHDACDHFGLSHDYVPHSLRHGGATHWQLEGFSADDILQRGRWTTSRSMRRYIQSGRARLIARDIPPPTAEDADFFVEHVRRAFALSQ